MTVNVSLTLRPTADVLVLTNVSTPDTFEAAALNSFTTQPTCLQTPFAVLRFELVLPLATRISYLVELALVAFGACSTPAFGFMRNFGAENVMPSISTRMPSVPSTPLVHSENVVVPTEHVPEHEPSRLVVNNTDGVDASGMALLSANDGTPSC